MMRPLRKCWTTFTKGINDLRRASHWPRTAVWNEFELWPRNKSPLLGHSNSGAVAATIKADEVPGQISGLFQHIRPAAKEARGVVDKAVVLNVRNQATTLAESSPVIAKLVRDKKLIIAGGDYDLTTGKVARVELPQLES